MSEEYQLEIVNPEPPRTSAMWLVIFTDLVALMLTFFVMLFSMTNVKVDRWDELTDALSRSLNVVREKTTAIPAAEYNISSEFRKRAIDLNYLLAVLDQKVKRNRILANSPIVLLGDRIVISLPGGDMFEAGNAELGEGAISALFDLGGVLRHVSNQIGVNGYADEDAGPDAASDAAYDSDWELSLARAIAIANAIKGAGYTDDIVSYGYGNSRAAELKNLAKNQRQILSRRIDIVIMSTGGAI